MTAILETTAPPMTGRASSAWLGLMALGLAVFNAFAMRGVFSPLQDTTRAALHLSDFQMSLVQGLAASIPVALLSLPLGRITDRGNRMRLLLALGAVWTAGTLSTAFATEFYSLFFARMLASIGAMCAVPVAISIAADMSAPATRGRALLLLSLGNMSGVAAAFAFAGGLLAPLQATPLLGLAPWRGVHLIFAAASALLLLPLLFVREPARREVQDAAHTDLKAALRAIWKRRALLAPLFVGQISVIMADTAAGVWAGPVLSRTYHLGPEQYGAWMGLVILASGIVGSILGGVLADAGHKSRIKGGILIGAVIASVLSIPGAAYALMPDSTGFAWMLTLFLTCGAMTGLITAAAIAVLIPNEIRGVCLAAFMVFGSIIGLGLAPTMVTWLSAILGGDGAVRYGLAATGIATSVAAAFGFIMAMRRGATT